jgi:peptidoglycan/xylan/chitin deacetylase (PgdA/CDA1 family)
METLVKIIITTGDLLGLWDTYAWLLERLTHGRGRIINFHRVADDKPYPWMPLGSIRLNEFEKRISYICSKYKLLTLQELAYRILMDEPLLQDSMVLTFDDGYKDMFSNAYPVLRKYSAPATVFLTTGHIGSGELFWWDKIGYVIYNSRLDRIQLDGVYHSLRTTEEKRKTVDTLLAEADTGSEDRKKMLINNLVTASGVKIPDGLGEGLTLSWSEIRAMSNDGIDFGAHTVTHPVLTRVSLEQAKSEIFQSKIEIENRLNKPVTTFAYPRGMAGDFNTQTVALVKQAGFKCAVTAIPGMVSQQTDPYQFGRIAPGDNRRLFKFLASGLWYDLQSRRSG